MLKNWLTYIVFIFCVMSCTSPNSEVVTTNSSNKNWWGGVINDGDKMPLQSGYTANLIGNNYGNQIQPLLLSDEGDVVWSEGAFGFEVKDHNIVITEKEEEVIFEKGGNSLREAFQFASKKYFPTTGEMPDELLFSQPQYNTWIELMYDQNQKDILKYAQAIIDNGMPPGVLMIDDNWQENYGKWDFHPGRFPDPKAMMKELHQMGFKVMVWVCPFVSADSDVYRALRDEELLLKNKEGQAAIIRWWNGASGLLDLSHPKAVKWFKEQLTYLQTEYGVDGFKLDAGDTEFYENVVSHQPTSANEHTRLFALIGLDFPLNEYRANWKTGGKPIANRLRDKNHDWADLKKLVPNMIMEGLMGYTYACPDMIGGGEFKSFLSLETIDQELIVRSAQCHALMPMMQFSVAPWRILDKQHLDVVLASVKLRERFREYIVKEARNSATTGEPILRSMEYNFPRVGFAKVSNQFFIGEKLLVVPVMEKGIKEVEIILPDGTWKGFDGKTYQGNQTIKTEVTLETLPFFEKI